jgi:WD40 repeat protein
MKRTYFPVWLVIALAFAAMNIDKLNATPEPTPTPITTPKVSLETLQTLPNTWFGHVAMSPDFQQFAVVSCKKLFVYDATTYQVVNEFPYSGEGSCFDKVAFGSSDFIAFTTTSDKMEIWDTNFERKVATFELADDSPTLALVFNINEKLLLVGRDDGILMWETEHFTENPSMIVIPDGYVVSYATGISPDGTIFAIEDHIPPSPPEHSVGIWNVQTRQRLARLNTGTEVPRQLTFSPDGQLLAVGTETGLVQLWGVEDAKLQAEFNVGTNIVGSIAFSPDGKYLAVQADNFTVWRLEDSNQTDSLPIYSDYVAGLAFKPNSDVIMMGVNEKLHIWHYKK